MNSGAAGPQQVAARRFQVVADDGQRLLDVAAAERFI
jgi:hypothetical protein